MSERVTKPADKEVIKEALEEWLDKKFAQFGRWSLGAILALALAGCVYLALVGQGWHK